jgi:hypothetical protein
MTLLLSSYASSFEMCTPRLDVNHHTNIFQWHTKLQKHLGGWWTQVFFLNEMLPFYMVLINWTKKYYEANYSRKQSNKDDIQNK